MSKAPPILPGLLAVCSKPVHITFDGGMLSFRRWRDGAGRDRSPSRYLQPSRRVHRDKRAPEQVRHQVAEIIRFRALAIAAGHAGGGDCDSLRADMNLDSRLMLTW